MNNRKLEVLRNKVGSIICVIIVVFISIYYDYNFENGFANGIMLFTISVFSLTIFSSECFYIETGLRLNDKEAEEKAYIYAEMHPGWAIRNQIIYLLFYLSSFISLIFLIIGVSEVI